MLTPVKDAVKNFTYDGRKMILIPLKTCTECKHCYDEKVYTADSWDDVNKLICRETKRKKNEISSYHERGDPPPQIPKWCPLRKKVKYDAVIKILKDLEFDEMPHEDDIDDFKQFVFKYGIMTEEKLKELVAEYE